MPPPKKALIIGAGGFLGYAMSSAYLRHGWEAYGLIRNDKHAQRLAADEIVPIVGSLDDTSLPSSLEATAQYFNTVVVSIDQIWEFLPLLESIIRLSHSIAEFSKKHGVKPLVFLTSGMKDHGETGLDGAPGLRPITEETPLNPPEASRERALSVGKILEHGDVFDGVVVRPPNLYGLSGSVYGYFFMLAERAQKTGVLELPADSRTILHSAHVEDCAEAYVALSDDSIRDKVRGQNFNIAGSRYETLGGIAEALVREYGIPGGAVFKPEERKVGQLGLDFFILGFSEWISSEKIRKLSGWGDKRALFSEKIHLYRQAFEAAVAQNHPGIQSLQGLLALQQ